MPFQLRLTEFKLKKGFRQLFGMSMSDRRFQHRMNRALQLLKQTDKPEKEIAFLTGYRGLPSFISAFKKHFGVTPGQWRKPAWSYLVTIGDFDQEIWLKKKWGVFTVGQYRKQ